MKSEDLHEEATNTGSEEQTNSVESIERVVPNHITILPLFSRPLFPGLPLPMTFTGADTVRVIKQVMEKENGFLGLVYAPDVEDNEEPTDDQFEGVGTLFRILRIAQADEQSIQVLGQGVNRFTKKRTLLTKPSMRWEVTNHFDSFEKPTGDLKAYMMAISANIKELLKLNPLFQEQVNLVVNQLNQDSPGATMNIISNLLNADPEDFQELLETFPLRERAELLLKLIKEELQLAKLQQKINNQINAKVDKQQKEFFLREQLKAIKKELGLEKEDGESEVDKIEARLKEKELPAEVLKVVEEELNKLKLLNAQSPDFNVTRSYLELIADLPWGIYSVDNQDVKKARKALDAEHYGLDDVKDTILEFLSAVIKSKRVAGSIICLVGPPGVGKTSIGKSIAAALGRKFFRFSVGGMRDEAEIKGHRRTYIGAMPGKLIQALKRVETSNPVIMLDEIDKIGASFRGDPASALLEVLDPEQNNSFLDHYLDVPYDLSNVLFITTANQLDTIPGPLRDRMEIIRLPGYILEDKLEIAKRYLIPNEMERISMTKSELKFNDSGLRFLIDGYAREAGVRHLEKLLRKIIRKVNLELSETDRKSFTVNKKEVERLLGKPYFRKEELYSKSIPGVVLGLAYTAYGGATLYIEAAGIPSSGPSLKQTGQLGNVMKESSEIAFSVVRALLGKQKPKNEYLEQHHVHLHVPAGATPKDGPSAGITMALALYSLATNQPVKENIAMTGELTLTGKVLPIGGVREKTIGARRVGVYEIILPIDNERDYEELPAHIKEGMTVHFANYFSDVLAVALKKPSKKSEKKK